VVGNSTSIVKTVPTLVDFSIANFITSGRKGSGDNAYIYASPFAIAGFTTGTVPVDEKAFTISGSMTHPARQFAMALEKKLNTEGVSHTGKIKLYSMEARLGNVIFAPAYPLDSIVSPNLDSVNYWFLQKSINLYGEALIKAIAFRYSSKGATEDGVDFVKRFCNQLGIESSAVNIIDGSGLSPQNRITTYSLVKILRYAKTRSWYRPFFYAIPTFNGIKMKSGSIGGARSFAGYHTSTSGKQYVFAIILNNYDGPSNGIVQKIYKVLDLLK